MGTTTYFGHDFSGNTASDRAVVLGWARGGAAGMDAAFAALRNGSSALSHNGSLATIFEQITAVQAFAASHTLDLVAYEGGFHGTATLYAAADQAAVIAFFDRLNADPRMGALYDAMADGFEARGGALLAAFTDTGKSTASGTFGLLSSIYETTSPRYEALLDKSEPTRSLGQSLSDAVLFTTEAAATVTSGPVNLTYTGNSSFTGTGNAADNILVGGNAGARLSGLAGADLLTGGAGADVLDGGPGADRMAGGAGDDVFVVDNADDRVTEFVNGGTDEVRTTLTNLVLADQVEKLTYTGNLAFVGTGNMLGNVIIGGSSANQLYGGAGADRLVGGAAADLVDGGTGADALVGGAGNDIYLVDNAGDTITEFASGGIDEVRTTLASYQLGAEVETMRFTGTGAFIGRGNVLDNAITGSTGADQLFGGGGADVLTGGLGADLFDGGTGADRMVGGAGDDIYIVDNAGDAVVELAGEGTDEVRTSLASHTLAANVERLTYTGSAAFAGVGNTVANTIVGGAGADTLSGRDGNDQLFGGLGNDLLDGGAGADRMTGGSGDDTYLIDNTADVAYEQPGGGDDTVRTSVNYTLGANLEHILVLEGARRVDGNALDNTIKEYVGRGTITIAGGAGDDNIICSDALNTVYGGTGDDQIAAGGGNDVLVGGAGKDWLNGGAGGDRFVFAAGDSGATRATADFIADFSRAQRDQIDLSALDANPVLAGDQALTFLGAAAFSRRPGELRVSGSDLMIDFNGDGIADFALVVTSATMLQASDFIL